jgi:hypothetical protein
MGATGPAGGVFGSAIADFGSADNGGADAMSVTVTVAAAWVTSTSYPIVEIGPGGDHTDADDLTSEEVYALVTNIVIGVSFDIEVFAPNGTWGQWLVNWGAALTGSNDPTKANTSTTISAGDGMAGGGDLSANRTLAVDGTVIRSTDVRMAAAWQRYNAIRNPEMLVAQRGTSIATIANNAYGLDGWSIPFVGTMVATVTQNAAAIPADTSGNNWYPYTAYAHRVTFTTGQSSLSAGHYFFAVQHVEGLIAEKLKSNPTSISLLVRSNITGTFTVSLRDSLNGYSCVNTGVITSANTWTRIAIPNIPTFTGSGTFPDGVGTCYQLGICMGAGSTFLTSTIGTWTAGNFIAATGQTNFAATTSNTFDFTLVQHEPNPVCTPYVKRELSDEIALNYRYLWMTNGNPGIGLTTTATNLYSLGVIALPTLMRAIPTVAAGSVYTPGTGSAGTVALGTASTNIVVAFNNGSGNWTVGTSIQLSGGVTAEL